ncbi:MAG TPA: hypothetical protein VMB03_25025 [Bryobacteraceae bacterium]|nr:hypothetical protein [Bryobacteraceae bacterium]
MRAIRVLSVLSILAATSVIANAQSFNKVNAHIPYTVMVGSRELPPGDYEILPAPGALVGNLYALYSDDHGKFVGLLSATPTHASQAAPATELVLHANGQGEYTLDQLRIEGDTGGYEFVTPKSGDSHERESTTVEVKAESTR